MERKEVLFSVSDTPAPEMVLAVDEGLGAYNDSVAPLSDVAPLAAFVTTPSGQVIGGAVGRTWGLCCELQQLWVDPAHRSSGLGGHLLQIFEDRATARGCTVFYLTTFSFQAPAFYARHGYTTMAEISGYSDGISKYLMHKNTADQKKTQGG